jgi:hypothetical protein
VLQLRTYLTNPWRNKNDRNNYVSCFVTVFFEDDRKVDDLSWCGWPWISTCELGKRIIAHSPDLQTIRMQTYIENKWLTSMLPSQRWQFAVQWRLFMAIAFTYCGQQRSFSDLFYLGFCFIFIEKLRCSFRANLKGMKVMEKDRSVKRYATHILNLAWQAHCLLIEFKHHIPV